MKKTFVLTLLALSLGANASVKIEEEVYVLGQDPEVVRELIEAGSVEVDHVTSEGFELYGSKGLMSYLDQKNLPYLNIKQINQKFMNDFPSYEEQTAKLRAIVAKNPAIVKMFSIGKSVQGRELWMLKISDNVDTDEVEPEFKYISSMHGDEITGRELTTMLIDEMVTNYGKDQELTELVNNTEIFIMPSMNPDGSELRQRGNARGYDLNRNFPEQTTHDQNKPDGRQAETQLVMKYQGTRQFALSANFHGGTIVANYPWDSKYDAHPLEDLVKSLSLGYSELNPEMRNSYEFPGGITNGAAWYIVRGGMQDWSYVWHNDLQITLEVSHRKWPRYSDIPGFYKSNRDSMVWYMKQIHQGAGFKFKRPDITGTVAIKQVSPVSRSMGSYAFKGSEFYKVLPAGEYEMLVQEKNGEAVTINVSVDQGAVRANGNYVEI